MRGKKCAGHDGRTGKQFLIEVLDSTIWGYKAVTTVKNGVRLPAYKFQNSWEWFLHLHV